MSLTRKFRKGAIALNEEEKSESRQSALDSFWDIGSLLPQKPKTDKYRKYTGHDTTATEISVGATPHSKNGENSKNGGNNRRITRPEAVSEVLFTYEPEGSLIRSVTVSSWPYSYDFYDKFIKDSERLFPLEGRECEYVPFVSYIPQYSQLTQKQLAYYLYFRTCAKRGVFVKSAISYILLLVFEIINLPKLVPAQEGLSLMTDLWLAYRDEFPAIDKYMCEWVCDYCLINCLTPPSERLDPILPKILDKATFKEFYLSGARDESGDGAAALSRALVRFASSYNWRLSKVLDDGNKPLFKKHIPAALEYLLEHADAAVLSGAKPVARQISRDAYAASLCCCKAKRRLDIEYLSFDRSIELKAVVTAAVKYAENRIRAGCGIKSRLKVPSLPPEILSPLAEYFDRELPVQNRPVYEKNAAEAAREAEYEKYYAPESTGFDLTRAVEIENKSWQVAKMLEVGEDSVEEKAVQPAETHIPTESSADGVSGWEAIKSALSDAEIEFLIFLARGEYEEGADRLKAIGILPDAAVDRINSVVSDFTGDILIEETDEGYALIEDYREEAAPLLRLP